MDISQGKVFYKPEAGTYLGKIIDIVDKPQVQTQYGLKNKVLIVWTLTQLNGAPYLDPEGQPFQALVYVTATMNEKSTQPLFRNLYKVVVGVLNGQQLPLITKFEQLEQLLLDRAQRVDGDEGAESSEGWGLLLQPSRHPAVEQPPLPPTPQLLPLEEPTEDPGGSSRPVGADVRRKLLNFPSKPKAGN